MTTHVIRLCFVYGPSLLACTQLYDLTEALFWSLKSSLPVSVQYLFLHPQSPSTIPLFPAPIPLTAADDMAEATGSLANALPEEAMGEAENGHFEETAEMFGSEDELARPRDANHLQFSMYTPSISPQPHGDNSSTTPGLLDASQEDQKERINKKLDWEPKEWFSEWGGLHGRGFYRNVKVDTRKPWESWYQPAFHAKLHRRKIPSVPQYPNQTKAYRTVEIEQDRTAFELLAKRVRDWYDRTGGRICGPPDQTLGYKPVERKVEERINLNTPLRWPSKLINIHTGQIEKHGHFSVGSCPPYIIGSYIWSPENLPEYPRLQRRTREAVHVGDGTRDYSTDDWEYTQDDFDAVVELVKQAAGRVRDLPRFWIIDEDDPERYRTSVPLPNLDSVEPQRREYIAEVYYYLVAEAILMGVQYVWLDSLCINQDDSAEKSKEIPLMADYYRNSSRCVVVSEMLRRKYAHRLGHLGHDFLDATFEKELLEDFLTERHRTLYGLENEVLGWLVGFHQLRVWVFQETYLPKSVVHRGRNIRLNTRDLLLHGIRDQNFQPRKFRNLFLNRLPLSGLPFNEDADDGFRLKPNQAIALIQKQQRKTLKKQDFIYAILALFPDEVRSSMPTGYDVSLPAAKAMLLFARVATGDVMALLVNEEPEIGEEHCISTAPGWLPRRYDENLYGTEPLGAWDTCGGFPSDSLPALCANNNSLWMKAPYYRIQKAKFATPEDVAISVAQFSKHPEWADSEWGKKRNGNIRDPRYPREEINEIRAGDLIISIQVLPKLTVNIYFPSKGTEGEHRALCELTRAAGSGRAAVVCIRASKHANRWLVLSGRSTSDIRWEILGSFETGLIRGGISNCGDGAPPLFEFIID